LISFCAVKSSEKETTHHPLVLSLLQKRVDPPSIALHQTQRLEMTYSRSAESWDACDRLEEQDPRHPVLFREEVALLNELLYGEVSLAGLESGSPRGFGRSVLNRR
jgi:hypothetical protein